MATDEFIIPPSSGALALHVLIISLFLPGKIVKLQNELANFSHTVKFRSKITKFNCVVKFVGIVQISLLFSF